MMIFSEHHFTLLPLLQIQPLLNRPILNPYLEFILTVNDLLWSIINLSYWSFLELADFGSNR